MTYPACMKISGHHKKKVSSLSSPSRRPSLPQLPQPKKSAQPPQPKPHPPKPQPPPQPWPWPWPHANACCSGKAYTIVVRLAATTNATTTVVIRFIFLKTDITFLSIYQMLHSERAKIIREIVDILIHYDTLLNNTG